MKLLALHVDYIKFKPLKKALKNIGELSEKEKKGGGMKDGLVILTAVEKNDKDVKGVVKNFVKNVKDIAKQVKAKNVVLYPYAHLSSNLASPDLAVKVLDEAEKVLKKDFKVVKAPFGYYKEFELKVKGHPLSELSREIIVEGDERAPLGVPQNSEFRGKEINREQLLKKMSKVKMSAKKPPKGLKSNIELGRDLDLYIVSEIVGRSEEHTSELQSH